MNKIRTGAILKAIKPMAAYRYDPRLRIPINSEIDFAKITIETTAMYLVGIASQITAIAELSDTGPADLHSFLIGDKIVWQAWYDRRQATEGLFSEAWEIIIP